MTPARSDGDRASSAGEACRSAGLGRRWLALVYEGFLLFALLLVAGFAVLPFIGPPHAGTAYTAQQLYLLSPTSSTFLFFIYVAIAGAYCIGFWSHGRRTLAMKTWRLALTTTDDGRVDIRRATKRYLAALTGAAAGLAGFWLVGSWGLAAGLLNYCWGWMDPDGQFLHDRIAGTRIIRT